MPEKTACTFGCAMILKLYSVGTGWKLITVLLSIKELQKQIKKRFRLKIGSTCRTGTWIFIKIWNRCSELMKIYRTQYVKRMKRPEILQLIWRTARTWAHWGIWPAGKSCRLLTIMPLQQSATSSYHWMCLQKPDILTASSLTVPT